MNQLFYYKVVIHVHLKRKPWEKKGIFKNNLSSSVLVFFETVFFVNFRIRVVRPAVSAMW